MKVCKRKPEEGHEGQKENGTCAVDQRETEDEDEERGAAVRTGDLRGLVPEGGQQHGGQRADGEEAVDGVSLLQPTGGQPSQEGIGDRAEVGDLYDH